LLKEVNRYEYESKQVAVHMDVAEYFDSLYVATSHNVINRRDKGDIESSYPSQPVSKEVRADAKSNLNPVKISRDRQIDGQKDYP